MHSSPQFGRRPAGERRQQTPGDWRRPEEQGTGRARISEADWEVSSNRGGRYAAGMDTRTSRTAPGEELRVPVGNSWVRPSETLWARDDGGRRSSLQSSEPATPRRTSNISSQKF